jgi:hypothetical protein
MFTHENTEGFSNADLSLLNIALIFRALRGEDEKNATDAINNAWREGATIKTLTSI